MAGSPQASSSSPAYRLRSALRWVGALLVLLALWQLVDSVTGGQPGMLGRLFYPSERVGALLEEASPLVAPYLDACRDSTFRESFDSVSVRRFDRWCEAAEGFAGAREATAAVALMRTGNLHFDRIVEKLLGAGGETARRGVALYEARGALRPLLEQVNSELAGASFSQALLGIVLAALGIFLLSRRKVPASAEVA